MPRDRLRPPVADAGWSPAVQEWHHLKWARARGMPVLTWTVRSLADRARAAEHTSQIIYEAA